MAAAAAAEPIDAGRIRVLDGDTIRIDGARPDHRLVGFAAFSTPMMAANSPWVRPLFFRASRMRVP